MLIEIRAPDDRLRGPKAVDAAPILTAALKASTDSTADLSRLRVICDFIQYRQNFREPVALRRVQPWVIDAEAADDDGENWEIAIDLRRAKPDLVQAAIKASLQQVTAGGELQPDPATESSPSPVEASGDPATDDCGWVALEDWRPGRRSLIWGFNSLYWKALSLWEQATGKGYESALPGGESDARNVEAARDLILKLFALWDGLAARRALPDELYVLELGVGNGNQARVFLDELRRLDRTHGHGDYYRRLHYLMGDYSAHVLELARKNVAHHAENVSSLVLDAVRPTETLGFLRYKAFLVYISNVYDNLPTDEIVRIGGHLFQVETRAFLSQIDAEHLAASINAQPQDLPELVGRLLRLGPELLAEVLPGQFPTPAHAVVFWRAAWDGLRLDERYVPLVELDTYEIAPEVGGELLRPIALAAGDLRMHVSNGAAASFADTLQLLHPHGVLQCHDLFVTDLRQYLNGFKGPGKYDGSVVNWVNGRLLAAIGSRRGFDVTFAPFAHRTGANVLTMTARARD
ncbi:MAG: class I SAM-dependent methyltransferase [Chloroflexi bacterium]|nr:class I SAM-dependent methyltransferase [Chloroflexota bacterium]